MKQIFFTFHANQLLLLKKKEFFFSSSIKFFSSVHRKKKLICSMTLGLFVRWYNIFSIRKWKWTCLSWMQTEIYIDEYKTQHWWGFISLSHLTSGLNLLISILITDKNCVQCSLQWFFDTDKQQQQQTFLLGIYSWMFKYRFQLIIAFNCSIKEQNGTSYKLSCWFEFLIATSFIIK